MSSQTAVSPRTAVARWSSRLALFGLALLATGVLLHRFTTLPTPVALNLIGLAFALSGLAILVGIVALIVVWRRGFRGGASAAVGIGLGLLQLAWPLPLLPAYLELPALNDITTDTADPPAFDVLARRRTDGANPSRYVGARFAAAQQGAYPDLKAMTIDRGTEDAFGVVADTLRRLKWQAVAESPPTGREPGYIEATERTLLMGYYDDIVIRIQGNEQRSRIDIRSSSRYGRHDFGRNAQRVRQFYRELKARLELAGPNIADGRGGRSARSGAAVVKRGKAGEPAAAAAAGKKSAVPRPDAQRAPAPKEKPR